MKKNFKFYKHWYKVHKELHAHYEEVYKSASKELRFQILQTEHYKSILDEVDVLLDKGCKPSLIRKVIENWKQRWVLDISLHFDLECGGIKGFNDSKNEN